jgi:hypothetical protein
MLKHTSTALRSGLVIAAVALLPFSEAAATGGGDPGVTLPTAPGVPPGRVCSVAWGSNSVQIVAGPGNILPGDNTLASVFPAKVPCPPPGPSGAFCLKWEYKWTFPVSSSQHSLLTLDSDLVLNATEVSVAGVGNVSTRVSAPIAGDPGVDFAKDIAEVRAVRFTTKGPVVVASLFTSPNAQVGKVTAGFAGSKRGFCGIQGAENATGGEFFQSQSKTITTNTLGCIIDWTLSPDNCVTNAVLNPPEQPNCTISLVNDIGGIIGQTCQAEISVPGSTTTCRWNSFARTNICVTVP